LVVVSDCLAVATGELVLVLTDPKRRGLSERLVERARALGAEVVLMEMAERETHGGVLPRPVHDAVLASDVVIAPTTKSCTHSDPLQQAADAGTRIASMPQATEDMLERTMAVDFTSMKRRSAALADLLTRGDHVHLTSPAGTDITFEIHGRPGFPDDGDLTEPGAFGNLPPGEAFIAPLEGRTNGTLVVDGTIWPVGLLDEPIAMTVVDGYATKIEGKDASAFEAVIEPHGRDAYAVAELGIGTNDAAALTGNVLEDEKIMGTVHVALGDNHSFGGTISVPSHHDGILLKPTLEINGKRVLDGGCLLV
jgi:leucyl aminopeptidase (aminopeptidase T)